MGRFKYIEIEGLLIEDFGKIFIDSINDAIKSSNLSEEQALKKISPKFKELLSDYEESISTLYLNNHKFSLDNFLKIKFKNQKKIANSHKESFAAFILYINGCFLIYGKIVEKLQRKKVDSIIRLTVALYGLIIRRADEIVTLLLNGYIDGAMIIWRSLYENAVILLVLAFENDNELADKFFQHSLRNSKRKIVSFTKNYKALKFPPLPKSTGRTLQKEIEKITNRYGKDFLENEYGWADNLFTGKQKANFMLLEERVELNRFRPYYILCCEQVHSNFNSFKSFMEGNKIILPRLTRQNLEFDNYIDPMQFTTSILHEINDYILYEFSIEEEYNVNVRLMRKIFEKQQKTFDKSKTKKPQKSKGTISMRNERFDFLHLPKSYHNKHKTCEFLLYQIEDFILKDSFIGLKKQTILFDKELELLDEENILEYLIRVGKSESHTQIITCNILNAIIADTCQFLQIALFSSLQQRLTVTFALIRKPFVYNLLLILRMYLTNDFLERFNNEERFDTTGLSKNDIIEILKASESMLFTKSIKWSDIFDFVFNDSLPDSLVNMSNKALHPSTTRNINNRTEVQNINFVFSSRESITSQWDYLYKRLPLLLMYLNEVLEFIVSDVLKLPDDIYFERLTERATFFMEHSTS